MTVAESKNLRKGSRVCWLGNAADSGSITETNWDAVTIAWGRRCWAFVGLLRGERKAKGARR